MIGKVKSTPGSHDDDAPWIAACATDDIELEDVVSWEYASRSFAIFRSPDNEFYCTDGSCTHEHVGLADGLVMDYVIECPRHNGQFDYRTGVAKRAPACVNLNVYPTRVENGTVFVRVK
ncbi:MocE family 2Fe-2S type ferredoxin [Mesorhizobium kowhaii]|uniref:MocE family 2Fe-2S type ferredoxin n=1 Tax=Mesorhizobium kowhaii TaxID=1300272 RepID=UPI0035E5FDBA